MAEVAKFTDIQWKASIWKLGHDMREGFRSWMWQRCWKESQRYELEVIRKKHKEDKYPAHRVKKMKDYMNDAVYAAIATGAVMSPACVGQAESNTFPTTCIACNKEGFHDHIYWECANVEAKVGVKRPKT